jgi:hypothetical protein
MGGNHTHFITEKMIPTTRQAATPQPRISQPEAAVGRRITEIPAMQTTTTGPTMDTASATSMIGPIPGMTRMSNPENRININRHHTAAQIARQQIAADFRVTFATIVPMSSVVVD